MSTIATQRASINSVLDSQADIYGETTTLTPGQQTSVTDAVATALGSLNPNHTYPPVNK